MLTSSQRASLRSLASGIKPILQIGKGGIGENFLKDLDAALEARELVKITVLRTSEADAKQLLQELAEKTGAEQVTAIGSKIVLYRLSGRGDVEHIKF